MYFSLKTVETNYNIQLISLFIIASSDKIGKGYFLVLLIPLTMHVVIYDKTFKRASIVTDIHVHVCNEFY